MAPAVWFQGFESHYNSCAHALRLSLLLRYCPNSLSSQRGNGNLIAGGSSSMIESEKEETLTMEAGSITASKPVTPTTPMQPAEAPLNAAAIFLVPIPGVISRK